MKLRLAVILGVVMGAVGVGGQQAPAKPHVAVGRSKIATKYGIVAASQPLAAQAGVQILERGGNAVDAAIATNAVMGLVEPHYNGIGGDLFAMYYEAKTGKLYGLNAGGWAPTGLTPALLALEGPHAHAAAGIYSVTVPGAVEGWEALRARFGTLPMSDLLAPAIFYADDGFPVTDVIASAWNGATREALGGSRREGDVYLPNGRAPARRRGLQESRPGQDAARSSRRTARPASTRARPPRRSSHVEREQGGTMTAADLTDYQPEWVDPISTTYRGWTVYELPPNRQGIAALMMLNIMEQFPLGEYGLTSTKAMHVMIEAKKLAYADMLRYVADPKFSNVPVLPMLSKAQAQGPRHADRSREGRLLGRARRSSTASRTATAATRSICPSSTATATSCR